MKRLGGYELKKSITVGLASLLAFSLSACGGENVESSTLEESSIVVSSTGEYATSEAVENGSDGGYEVEVPDLGTDNMNETYTLDMLTEEQLEIFKETIVGAADLINGGLMTVEDMDTEQNYLIEAYVAGGVLPENGIELFTEWKETTGYYDQFTQGGSQGGNSGEQSSSGGSQGGNSSGESEQSSSQGGQSGSSGSSTGSNTSNTGNSGNTGNAGGTPTNKPQPTEDQKTEQDNAGAEENPEITWENKEELEQAMEDALEDAGLGGGGDIDLDPDFNWN